MAMDLWRTRYIAEHYAQLQGLRIVPVGVCFLVSAAWRAGILSWVPAAQGRGARVWFLGLLAVAIVISEGVKRWYARQMGAAPVRPSRSGAATLVMSSVACGALASLPDNPWHVSPAVLLLVGILAVLGCVEHGLRRHYLWVALAWLGFAMMPAFDVAPGVRGVVADALIGLALIVGGVGDHAVLQRWREEAQGGWDGGAAE
jgi:hypothetical protein